METGFSKFFRSSLRDAEIILRAGQRIISEINILVENSQGSSQIPKSNPQLLNAEIKKKIARHENIKSMSFTRNGKIRFSTLDGITEDQQLKLHFSAETLAICQALDDLVESNVNLLVLSDSLSVLSALQNFSIKSNKVIHRLANKIYMLSNYVNQLILLWTPGHSKIVWNEQADNLARSVTESNVYIDWIASDDIHKNIYRNRIQKINETFYSSKYTLSQKNICTQKKSSYNHETRQECSLVRDMQMIKISKPMRQG
ncbi:RNase H domain-containing protein [Trichonephila clavipes]|nr:RNase H domain-containing protein [Trichonephila clavipes]